MKKLVVVADDFGLLESVNLGILKSVKDGIVTEVSFMVYASATEQGAEIIKKEKLEHVGLHLSLLKWEKGKKSTKQDYVNLFKTLLPKKLGRSFMLKLKNLFLWLEENQPIFVHNMVFMEILNF
ncbi:MAG: hypothetical protein Fur0024_0650 [Patescibacteria group bacterium]